jgi:hypothetical protein
MSDITNPRQVLNREMRWVIEPGWFDVIIAPNAAVETLKENLFKSFNRSY